MLKSFFVDCIQQFFLSLSNPDFNWLVFSLIREPFSQDIFRLSVLNLKFLLFHKCGFSHQLISQLFDDFFFQKFNFCSWIFFIFTNFRHYRNNKKKKRFSFPLNTIFALFFPFGVLNWFYILSTIFLPSSYHCFLITSHLHRIVDRERERGGWQWAIGLVIRSSYIKMVSFDWEDERVRKCCEKINTYLRAIFTKERTKKREKKQLSFEIFSVNFSARRSR